MPEPHRRPADPLPGVRRVLVIGLARSGRAAAAALARAGVDVTIAERRDHLTDTERAGLALEPLLGVDDDAMARLVDEVDVVVPSPGVSEYAPALHRARERGIPVWSEPELGWRLAPRRTVAVTGTNGKTSVTELTAAMLRAAGLDARACGNIGTPFTSAALDAPEGAVLVAELSSFQLRFTETLRPDVGVLLNLAPDHLDWHGDLAAYAAAKARLWRAQGDGDWAVCNAEDRAAADLARGAAPPRLAWFSHRTLPEVGVGTQGDDLVAHLPDVRGPVVALEDLVSRAPHHVANTAAAACAALLAGAGPAAVAAAARAFRPGAHRLEIVARRAGVTWIDDSKATNPHAATAALRAMRAQAAPVVWIAGGRAKGVDLAPLGDELAGVRHAVVMGEAAGDLTAVVAGRGLPVSPVASIEEAVRMAAQVARPGDVVLLAPACASQDQFRDYIERGERFAAAARLEATEPRSPAVSPGGGWVSARGAGRGGAHASDGLAGEGP